MKLWKADQERWIARLVEANPYPGRDEDGDICYDNTHFKTEEAAWDSLEANARAGVTLAGAAVLHAQSQLREAEATAGQAAAELRQFIESRRKVAGQGG